MDDPDWFTALDRKRIEQARTDHGPPFHGDKSDRGRVVVFNFRYPSDADARAALLAQFQVFVDVLNRYGDRPELADQAIRRRDALIVDVDLHRPKDTWPTLDAFVTAIDQALADEPWWPVRPAPAPARRSRRSRRSYPNRAAWLKRLMGGLTPYAFHKQFGGPDAKSIRKILAGDPVDDDVLTKLVGALNDAGHRVTFEQIPRD